MVIQRVDKKLVKKSVLVEKDDYELIMRCSELRDQSISAAFRELMPQPRMCILGRTEKIEQGKLLIQEAIRKYEVVASTKDNTKLESKSNQFADYRALGQVDSLPPENNQF